MLAQKHPAADEDNRVPAFNCFASPPVFQAFEPLELRPRYPNRRGSLPCALGLKNTWLILLARSARAALPEGAHRAPLSGVARSTLSIQLSGMVCSWSLFEI
jgi:hypothetical protein